MDQGAVLGQVLGFLAVVVLTLEAPGLVRHPVHVLKQLRHEVSGHVFPAGVFEITDGALGHGWLGTPTPTNCGRHG